MLLYARIQLLPFVMLYVTHILSEDTHCLLLLCLLYLSASYYKIPKTTYLTLMNLSLL